MVICPRPKRNGYTLLSTCTGVKNLHKKCKFFKGIENEKYDEFGLITEGNVICNY